MSINTDSIEYYNKNVVLPLKNWNILSNATLNGEDIDIKSGGTTGYELANIFNNGLKASKYRSLNVSIEVNTDQQYNYQNYVEIVLKGVYRANEGNLLNSMQSINLTYLKSSIELNTINMERVISMQNYDFESLTIYVINHTKGNIKLKNCVMKRSQDINSSQVGESIGFGIALRKVVSYLDGCEVYYDGEERPTKLWWSEDEQGQFNGVNVDNERLISFERKNEILLD